MVSRSPTENTITSLLAKELERFGVKALPFVRIKTPIGYREVDLWCYNSGRYPVEAKFSEDELWKAAGKIYNDYIRYHVRLGIDGGFAILYPERLRRVKSIEELRKLIYRLKFKLVCIFPPEDKRKGFTVIEGPFRDIAKTLASHILAPPEYIEPDIPKMIDVLRDSAKTIAEALRAMSEDEVEAMLGGKDVFKNILQYEEGKYPLEDLRLVVSYILVNQLLFYHVISRYREEFPPLEIRLIKRPSDLQEYFRKVYDVNYKAVFSYDIASLIPERFTDMVKLIIGTIQAIAPEKVKGDLLGTIFHDLVPLNIRKSVAAFYTNVLVAELLAHLAIDRYDAKVADLACGSGGLLVAAYRRKRYLLEKEREFTQRDHSRFVEEDLLGIDVMPFAANVAACHLSLQAPEFFTDKVRIAIYDSTARKPGDVIPSVAGLRAIVRGQVELEKFIEPTPKIQTVVTLGKERAEEIKLEKVDVVIMNPPFTRQERIPREYKDVLFRRFSEYADYLHGQLSYYGYFILLADRFLKEGGRMALVLPAAFLRTKSTKGLRRLLNEKYHIEFIITGRGRLNFSEATWRREILLVARKLKRNESKGKTFFVAIPSLPKNLSEAINMSEEIKRLSNNIFPEKTKMLVISVEPNELERNLNWFKFITAFGETGISELWESLIEEGENLIKFEDLYDTQLIIREGIESRRGMKLQFALIPKNIKRAIRREDVWIVDREDNEVLHVYNRFIKDLKVTIPKNSVVPALRTTAGNSKMDLTSDTDFVVIRDFPESNTFFFGERRVYKKVLSRWEKYVRARMGNLIIQRRFPINAPGTIHISYYSSTPVAAPGTTWIANLPDEDAKILCLWFNSSIHLAQIFHERIEDIWLDVHKYILKNMLVLNPRSLKPRQKRMLIKVFEEVSHVQFPSLERQYEKPLEERRKIDLAILGVMGFKREESEQLLVELYTAIRRQFKILKEIS